VGKLATKCKTLIQEFYHSRHRRPGQYSLYQGATLLLAELPKKRIADAIGQKYSRKQICQV